MTRMDWTRRRKASGNEVLAEETRRSFCISRQYSSQNCVLAGEFGGKVRLISVYLYTIRAAGCLGVS